MNNKNKKIILIVEDELPLLNVLQKKIELEGYQVLTARDGEEGLKTALSVKPDLILLDLIMPVMDGITMLQKLREEEWGRTAEVIILTNLSGDKHVSTALKDMNCDFWVKSDLKIADIIKKLKEKLSN